MIIKSKKMYIQLYIDKVYWLYITNGNQNLQEKNANLILSKISKKCVALNHQLLLSKVKVVI